MPAVDLRGVHDVAAGHPGCWGSVGLHIQRSGKTSIDQINKIFQCFQSTINLQSILNIEIDH